jgi:hypothetical protein
MDKQERQKLRQLDLNATAPPWHDCGDIICVHEEEGREFSEIVMVKRSRRDDIALIVALRNSIGPLLDYVDELETHGKS